MNIVEANQKDYKTIEALAKEIWEEHFTSIIGEQQVAYMLNKFQSEAAIKDQVDHGYTYYLLQEDSSNVGFMGIQFNVEKTLLSKLYIKQEARGKGFASQAIQYVSDMCLRKGCTTIWLTCNKENESTLQKYKKMGFEIFDSVVNPIGEGYVMDDYYLMKKL